MRPRDFEVNGTWLAFRINQAPVVAGDDAVDIFVLQDAASMLIFGNAFAPHGDESPAADDVAALMQQAWSRSHAWPGEIVLAGKPSPSNAFVRVAKRNGIPIRTVAESAMSFYIKDVQTSFEEFLALGRERDN